MMPGKEALRETAAGTGSSDSVVRLAACTNVGTRKSVNQDSHCIKTAKTTFGNIVMAVVCDGVGGLSGGEVASSTCVLRFTEWFERELPAYLEAHGHADGLDLAPLKREWAALLDQLNATLRDHGRKEGSELGTTFSGIILCQNRYLTAHVGDSRIYRFSEGKAEVLTSDHTLIAQELAKGTITAEEAKTHPQGHVILQSVGTERTLSPDFAEGSCRPSDLFMLCTDGFYHLLSIDELEEEFGVLADVKDFQLEDVCEKLVRRDLERGETDNITVLCFCDQAAFEAARPPREDDADPTVFSADDRGASSVSYVDDAAVSHRPSLAADEA